MPVHKIENDTEEALLRVEHLSQYFKKGRSLNKAVSDVSFSIKKGEVFGLVGESGCGKTTTGRAIIGLYQPTSGEIWYGGERIDGLGKRGRKRLASKIQMIYQDPMSSLDPRMTVYDIIAEGLLIRGERDRKYLDDKVYGILDLVGLTKEHAARYPHEFSGGQRQRIGIARAVVMEPELIIADEPVSALDVSVQAQVINLLNDLRQRLGLTILFVAHDLSVVKYFSDRIGVMYFGRLVELAASEELFKHPLHPYTRSLLSAIPLPDPVFEKKRQRQVYRPGEDGDPDHLGEDTELLEVRSGHFVRCTEKVRESLYGELNESL